MEILSLRQFFSRQKHKSIAILFDGKFWKAFYGDALSKSGKTSCQEDMYNNKGLKYEPFVIILLINKLIESI